MSVGSTRGRRSAPQSIGRREWTRVSDSSKGSGFSEVFEDPSSPRAKSAPHQGQVFTLAPSMRYTHSHILRYGTTRSMPEDTTHHHRHSHHHSHNTTTSSHYNGHIISNGHATTGRRLYSSNPRGGKPSARRIFSTSGTFRRGAPEKKKEDAISFFDIEMEKSPFYQYRPGEEISGAVHMDVRHNVEIRFVELVIAGQGTTTVMKSKQGGGMPATARETYLKKQTFVIGTGDAMWSSVLTPGHYVSRFRFKLPKELPSTLVHDDLSSGFKMDINYYIKARICDDVGGSSSGRSSSSGHQHHLVKVLLSKRQPFRVQRPFDINLIPSASTPVTHTEEVYLSCAGNNLVVVTLNLERAVFLAGDDIKLHLAASIPPSQRIKAISCRLQQHLKLDKQHDLTTFVLSVVERSDPQATSAHSAAAAAEEAASYDVTLPTQTNLVTSFLQGCSMLRLTYTLAIDIRFAPAGGKLTFTIPLGIGPCAEPIYAEKIASRKAVPIFNRPTRFPCFSPTPAKPVSPLQHVDRSSRSSQSINVVTKYSNSVWAKCFLCCFSAGDAD